MLLHPLLFHRFLYRCCSHISRISVEKNTLSESIGCLPKNSAISEIAVGWLRAVTPNISAFCEEAEFTSAGWIHVMSNLLGLSTFLFVLSYFQHCFMSYVCMRIS